jgi:histone-lysine N-methyltransferase SETMAR
VFLNDTGGSRKGEMFKTTQEVGSQKRKEQMDMWTEYEPCCAQRLGVRAVAEELNMNRETVRQIVKEDLWMRKFSAKIVPRILTHDQKQRLLYISSDLLPSAEMFDRVITGDETWCFQYDPETKRQSVQWKTQNSSRLEKARLSRSQVKTIIVCFFDHYELIAQGRTVNQQ